jgi:hypothetical protein
VHRSHRCIGMVYPVTLFIGDNGAFLCIPMKIGVKFEHCAVRNCAESSGPERTAAGMPGSPGMVKGSSRSKVTLRRSIRPCRRLRRQVSL